MPRRGARVSDAQWNILLEFLEQNPSLAKNRSYNNSSQGRNESRRLWENIANALNAEGSGSVKSPKEWATYVSNHKSKLKKLAAGINADANATGGGPPQGVPNISDVDQRFLAIMGPGFGQSSPRVIVEPFPEDQQQPSTSHSSQQQHTSQQNVIVADFVEVVENEEILSNYDIDDVIQAEIQDEIPAESQQPEVSVGSRPPDVMAPRLPRLTRRTRLRHRPLAPLEAAQKILSQVETQRSAAELANSQALQLIGESLRRLADAAERFVARGEPQ